MSSTRIHSGEVPADFSPHSLRDARGSGVVESHIDPGEIAVGVIIGRASEYFDFFVYAIASVLVFPQVFFPFEERLEGTLYAFLIFSFAFIARPFGTVIFMEIQRRLGRSAKLTIALFLLGVSTAGIAFLPTYSHLGFAAIVWLAVLRIGQGVALGGSWDGLPSLLALNAPENKRGWYAMLGQLGAPVGFIVAAALFARLRLVVTHEYEQEMGRQQLEPVPVAELLREKGVHVVIGAFAALASYAMFHIVTIFPISWILLYSDQPIADFLVVQVGGGFLAIAGVLASGVIADRFGRVPTLGAMALAIAVFSGFAPALLGGDALAKNVYILVGFLLLGLSYGQSSGALTRNFGPRYRYTGAALTSDLAWLIGAAFAPLVALGLCASFGLGFVGLYLLSGAVSTLVALLVHGWMKRRDAAAG